MKPSALEDRMDLMDRMDSFVKELSKEFDRDCIAVELLSKSCEMAIDTMVDLERSKNLIIGSVDKYFEIRKPDFKN